MRINLYDYVGQASAHEPQKQMIQKLIIQLHYYITAPINEFQEALPQIEALEKECQDLDEMQGKPKTNYIKEILVALHEEIQNDRMKTYLREDKESLFSKVAMSFQEKITRIKSAGKSIYELVGYR